MLPLERIWKKVQQIPGLPRWLSGKESACQCRRSKRRWFDDPWVRKIPWRWEWQPTTVFMPGKSHGQRSLTGYSWWDHKELDRTENNTHNNKISIISNNFLWTHKYISKNKKFSIENLKNFIWILTLPFLFQKQKHFWVTFL